MKKTLIAAGILVLLATLVCIERTSSPADRRKGTPAIPAASGFVPPDFENPPSSPARAGERKQPAAPTPASFQAGGPDRALRPENPGSGQDPSRGTDSRTPPDARQAPPPGAVLPMELEIGTARSGPDLQSVFSNKSPLLLAIRYDGELFKLDRWLTKTLDISGDPAPLDVFVWGIVNGREEWRAVYATVIDPKPGALHLPLEFHGTPVKPAGPPPADNDLP